MSYQPKWIKVKVIICCVIKSSLLYPKLNDKKLDCLKTIALIFLTTPTVSLDFKVRVLQ